MLGRFFSFNVRSVQPTSTFSAHRCNVLRFFLLERPILYLWWLIHIHFKNIWWSQKEVCVIPIAMLSWYNTVLLDWTNSGVILLWLLLCHFPYRPDPHPDVQLTYMYSYAIKGSIFKILWIICHIEINDTQPHWRREKIYYSKTKGKVFNYILMSIDFRLPIWKQAKIKVYVRNTQN